MHSMFLPIWHRFRESRLKLVLTRHFLLLIFITGVGALSLYLSHSTDLSGDEVFYYTKAALLSKSIIATAHKEPVDIAALVDQVIGMGWFMPGMAIVLTPVQVLFKGEAPIHFVRAYMTLVNLALICLIAGALLTLGVARRYAYLAVIIPCAVPYYLFYLGMVWGDLVGVHLALILLLSLERRILKDKPGCMLESKDSLIVGLLLVSTALIRPQYIFLLPIVLVRVVLQKIQNERDVGSHGCSWASVLMSSLLIVFSIVIVLAPWHYELNKKFGRSFMITSTLLNPLVLDGEYAGSAIREFGIRNPFLAVQRKIENAAKTEGRSFREQVDFEKDKLPEKSIQEKLRRLKKSMGKFYFSENSFLVKFFEIQKDTTKFFGVLGQGLLKLNTLSWYFVLSLGLLAFCVPAFPRKNNYLLPVSLKGLTFLLTIQPLFLNTHGRYYVALVPMFALLFLLALRTNPREAMKEFGRPSAHNRLILSAQVFALFYGAANVWIFMGH